MGKYRSPARLASMMRDRPISRKKKGTRLEETQGEVRKSGWLKTKGKGEQNLGT